MTSFCIVRPCVRRGFVIGRWLCFGLVWRSLSVDVFYLLYESLGGTPFDVVGHNFFATA